MHDSSSLTLVRKATVIGMLANVLLAGAKIGAGVFGRSTVLVADGVHSISDLVTDIVLLLGTVFWGRPPDEDHPHGHRRIETLITLGIGLSLGFVGIMMGAGAILHFNDPGRGRIGSIALVAALVSIVVKEWLYRWTLKISKQARSSALKANAWHHRSDAFSSIPAALAVASEMLVPSLRWIDRLGVLVVCVFILNASWGIFHPAFQQLADAGAPRETIARLSRIALEVRGAESAHALRTRYLGSILAVDLHIEVNGDIPVSEGFAIAEEVKTRLHQMEPDIGDVLIQVEPVRTRNHA